MANLNDCRPGDPGKAGGGGRRGLRYRPLTAGNGSPTPVACRTPVARDHACEAVDPPVTTPSNPAEAADCQRQRVGRIVGIAARLVGPCPTEPPPLLLLPIDGGP